MAWEVDVTLLFEREPDMYEVNETVERVLECSVVGWDAEEV